MNGAEMDIEVRIEGMAAERRALAGRVGFLDCSLWLGRPEGFPLAVEVTAGELTGHLRRSMLAGGLVSHWRARTSSAQDGNAGLVEVDGVLPPECWTVWTGLPLYPVEQGPVPGRGDPHPRMRGVRLYPRTHAYPLADWCTGSLCTWLSERRIPLFLQHTEFDWSSLRALALKFTELPIVVESQPRKILYHTRPLFLLLKECRNVHLEISNFAGAGFLDHAAREFGPERLLFGSFMPVSDPFVPMGMVLDGDLGEADKALIASGNLRRLVEGVAR
jgi:uncharacterized protein